MARRKGFSSDNQFSPQRYHREEAFIQQTTDLNRELKTGQRWLSEMEPELGLGEVIEVDNRLVTISFHNGGDIRKYSKQNAPLIRLKVQPGSPIMLKNGDKLKVRGMDEEQGIIIYDTEKGKIPEAELSFSMKSAGAADRLLSSDTDPLKLFDLRVQTQNQRSRIEGSEILGFTGPRIELIPHQLYIAREVTSRPIRRILLADEVGLGKTIESCLILHRLALTGRASRVLVIIPETLMHIWFVELLRKFNLSFRIFDNEYIKSLKGSSGNPFLGEQNVLCAWEFLSGDQKLCDLAFEAGWDLLIVDEVHNATLNSPYFKLIEKLADASKDALFLSATPEQYGAGEYFNKLSLLDKNRYSNFETFQQEAQVHSRVASLTGRIMDLKPLEEQDLAFLQDVLEDGANIPSIIDDKGLRNKIVNDLLDRYGMGRTIFRNTRSVIGGFPVREVRMAALDTDVSVKRKVAKEFLCENRLTIDTEYKTDLKNDPRIAFTAEIVKSNQSEKFVLICRSKEKAVAVNEALGRVLTVRTALFHEDLTIIQRDRNAAWFSEQEGARLLICSEIGSEGRNFQFAHHLILFDLPPDPSLVEQRIGRLDRIGQSGPVIIHVPYIKETPYETLARLFNEGLDLFATAFSGVSEIFDRVSEPVFSLFTNVSEQGSGGDKLGDVITLTRTVKAEVTNRLHTSRDRLLELHSFRPDQARSQIDKIIEADSRHDLENLVIKLLEQQGVQVEQAGNRTYHLSAEGFSDMEFTGIRESRPVITFDRKTALHREDYEFITMDHPVVRSLFDTFLGSVRGNSSLALWLDAPGPLIILDTIFILEPEAPVSLNAGRFFPPVVIRNCVDQKLEDRTIEFTSDKVASKLKPIGKHPLVENERFKKELFPELLSKAEELCAISAQQHMELAHKKMAETLGSELQRLIYFRDLNGSVCAQEISMVESEMEAMSRAIRGAVPRLDAVRVVVGGVRD